MGVQHLMDSAYAKFRRHDAWRDRFLAEGLSGREKAAVLLGNFNYQVENGGAFQWWDNGYATALGPAGTPAWEALAVLAEGNRHVDAEVADRIAAVARHAGASPPEPMSSPWHDDEAGDSEDPVGDHWEGFGLDDGYVSFGSERRRRFMEGVVAAYPEDADPFLAASLQPQARP